MPSRTTSQKRALKTATKVIVINQTLFTFLVEDLRAHRQLTILESEMGHQREDNNRNISPYENFAILMIYPALKDRELT